MRKLMKKYTAYIFILIILAGLLSPVLGVKGAQAQTSTEPPEPLGKCTSFFGVVASRPMTFRECTGSGAGAKWEPNDPNIDPKTGEAKKDAVRQEAEDACGLIIKGSLGGCLLSLFYFLFYGL